MSDGISEMHGEYTFYIYLCKEADEDPISIYDMKWVSHLEDLRERFEDVEA